MFARVNAITLWGKNKKGFEIRRSKTRRENEH